VPLGNAKQYTNGTMHIDYCSVCPHVKYANLVWCPFKIGDIKEIDKIQKRATKLVIKLKNKPYIDRLTYLNLSTLKYK